MTPKREFHHKDIVRFKNHILIDDMITDTLEYNIISNDIMTQIPIDCFLIKNMYKDWLQDSDNDLFGFEFDYIIPTNKSDNELFFHYNKSRENGYGSNPIEMICCKLVFKDLFDINNNIELKSYGYCIAVNAKKHPINIEFGTNLKQVVIENPIILKKDLAILNSLSHMEELEYYLYSNIQCDNTMTKIPKNKSDSYTCYINTRILLISDFFNFIHYLDDIEIKPVKKIINTQTDLSMFESLINTLIYVSDLPEFKVESSHINIKQEWHYTLSAIDNEIKQFIIIPEKMLEKA